MTLTPLFAAPDAVQMHVFTITVAMIATALILIARKGTAFHKAVGWVWCVMMMTTGLVTFWINSFDSPWGVSPIHLFSVLTLVSTPYAIWSIRRGNVAAHRGAMLGVVIGGMGIAGAFTLMQGRLMHEIIWGAAG